MSCGLKAKRSVAKAASSVMFESLESRQMLSAAAAAPVFKGPITITKGGTYSGNWQSLNANVPAITIRTSEPVIIKNSIIRSRNDGIDVYAAKANLTVRNTYAYGLNPNKRGKQPGWFIDVDGFANVVVENNYLENTAGIYVARYTGNHTAAQTVKIRNNVAKNIDGRISNGANGWINGASDPDHYPHFVILNGARGLAGAEIAWNQVINLPGVSRVEENINIHNATGYAKNPIRIHNNFIQGAFPGSDADARVFTGGGILLSDNGSSFVQAYNNQIVATGAMGIAVSSGHDNVFFNNRIISSGLSASGKRLAYSNVGAYIYNHSGYRGFVRNVGRDNYIGWINGRGERNDTWSPPGTGGFVNNKSWPGAVNKAAEAAEFTIWLNKVAANSVKLGVQTV